MCMKCVYERVHWSLINEICLQKITCDDMVDQNWSTLKHKPISHTFLDNVLIYVLDVCCGRAQEELWLNMNMCFAYKSPSSVSASAPFKKDLVEDDVESLCLSFWKAAASRSSKPRSIHCDTSYSLRWPQQQGFIPYELLSYHHGSLMRSAEKLYCTMYMRWLPWKRCT